MCALFGWTGRLVVRNIVVFYDNIGAFYNLFSWFLANEPANFVLLFKIKRDNIAFFSKQKVLRKYLLTC